MQQVFLIDDQPLVRHALTHLLDSARGLELCGSSTSAKSAARQVVQAKPDLLLMEICLRRSTSAGLRLLHEIRVANPDLCILVFTGQDWSLYARRCFDLGACGYLSKREPVERVLFAMRTVLDGGTYESRRESVDEDDFTHDERAPLENIESLSPRELEIFELVGQGESPHSIAQTLQIGLKTVDAHRQNIRRKLGLASMGDLIRQATVWASHSHLQ